MYIHNYSLLVFISNLFHFFQRSISPLLLRSLSTTDETSDEEEDSSSAGPGPLCQLDCSEERLRPVCGTDGITYPSRCHLQQAICQGNRVRLDYRGKCSDSKKTFLSRFSKFWFMSNCSLNILLTFNIELNSNY